MRIDKYLKVSRIIKRRTVANEACSGGRVTVNGKIAKPGTAVSAGDIIAMPGLPKRPAALGIDVDENGTISGLF